MGVFYGAGAMRILPKTFPGWQAVGRFLFLLGLLLLGGSAHSAELATRPLTATGDLSAQMVEGISRFLDDETRTAAQERPRFWSRATGSPAAYNMSVQTNRQRLRARLGLVDERIRPNELEIVAGASGSPVLAETI